jgi:glucokinase-like ROK family protein
LQITGDQHLVKKINKSIVLNTIKSKSPISRAQISELTQLNKTTVSSLVNELIEEKIVSEIGRGQSSGGRRPVMLLYNHLAGYAIGVDLGVNYILTVLTDLEGNIVHEKNVLLCINSMELILSQLKLSIREMLQLAPPSEKGIVGIGIGVPGIVDENGCILFAPNLGWKDFDLKTIIQKEFNISTIIHNEANAGALGEQLFGTGKGVSNLIYVSVGIGIGAGIILNNELYTGDLGFSGEFGHSIIEINGKKCSCGNRGCWELYASEHALLELAKTLNLPQTVSGDNMNFEYLLNLANNGNHDVINMFNQIGEYLAVGITNIINIFNPELIVIGNRMAKAEKWMINTIKRVIENRSLPYHRKQLRIEFSTLATHACALGASSCAISNYFTNTRVLVE